MLISYVYLFDASCDSCLLYILLAPMQYIIILIYTYVLIMSYVSEIMYTLDKVKET